VFIVVIIYFVIDSVWKILDTPSYVIRAKNTQEWKDVFETGVRSFSYYVSCDFTYLTDKDVSHKNTVVKKLKFLSPSCLYVTSLMYCICL
jgi:hypothetical protein